MQQIVFAQFRNTVLRAFSSMNAKVMCDRFDVSVQYGTLQCRGMQRKALLSRQAK